MSEAITISNDDVKESKYFTYEDLNLVVKRGGKGMPLNKIYNPKEFWQSMGDRFYKAFDKAEKCGFGVEYFIDRLKQFQPIVSLLDVGCGFGRLAPFLLQAKVIEKYTGIDIASSILKCNESYLDPVVKEDEDSKKIEAFFSNGNISDETKNIVGNDIKAIIDNLNKKASEKQTKTKVDFRENVSFKEADATSIPFESESFDCVISNECIQHLDIDSATKACQEMVRVSKKSIIMLERWAFPGEHSEPHIWSHNYNDIFNQLGVEILQVTTIAQGLQGVVARKR